MSQSRPAPLDDRRVERFNSDLAGRPTLVRGPRQLLFSGMGRLSENSVLNLKNKSHSVTAQITVSDGGANGVIISQGGAFGGWSLYLVESRPRYCYNLFGLQLFHVAGDEPVPAGDHQLRVEFSYDGGGLAKGGTATVFVDGNKVAQGRVDATVPMLFSGDETCDLGEDTASPVTDDYPADRTFTGRIHWVQLDIGDDDQEHLITPEQRLHVRDDPAIAIPCHIRPAPADARPTDRKELADQRPRPSPARPNNPDGA